MASLFLKGRQQEIIGQLTRSMDAASATLAFERAALYRDQIQSLRQIQDKQFVESDRGEDVDIVVVVEEGGVLCVNLAMVRGGRHLGDKPQFPEHVSDNSADTVLMAFLLQHYAMHPIPTRVYLNMSLQDAETAESLNLLANRQVPLLLPRSSMAVWVQMAEQNARLSIVSRLADTSRQHKRREALMAFVNRDRRGE